jgi:NAD(P)-dependent dehydrogenase (short-subunit alcohol dehydrogenase family)
LVSPPEIEPKRALITGAATGIGEAGARQLAAAGWRLALLDRAAEPLREVAAATDAVASFVIDAADPEALEAATRRAIACLGGLDAAWSNAGVQLPGGAATLSVADLDRSYAVNVRAHFVVAREAASTLTRGGSILVTASNSALQTEPEMLGYATTKAASVALVRGLARDLAPRGIRVNALCPGYVDTPFNGPIWSAFGGREGFLQQIERVIPLGRMATADEVAALGCFLLGDQAGYITGHTLVADGGELVS